MKKSRKYKKLRRSHGFTMIELLAVIIILGILTSLSVVAIQGVIKQAREKYYISQEESMTAAARNYVGKNKQYMPKVSGQTTQVYLRDLTKSKYIDEVVDYSKNKCDEGESYVQIFRYDDEYYYSPYLLCPSYETSEQQRLASYDLFEVKLTGDVSKLEGSFRLKERQEGIVSYMYAIYKDNKLMYQTEYFDAKKTKDTISKKINLTEYVPGKIKLSVTAINEAGISNTKTATKEVKNDSITKLRCGTITGDSNTWTRDARVIKVKCIDNGGIGCAKEEFTKKFDSDGKTGSIRIYDKEGKYKDCPVNVYIDRTAPTVPKTDLYKWKDNSTTPTSKNGLSGYTPGQWSSKKVFTMPSGSSDGTGSGGIYYQYKTSGAVGSTSNKTASYFNATAQGDSTISYRACDKLGNCSNYNNPSSIKLDWNAPTAPAISGGSDSWRNTNRIIWVTGASSAKSGIQKYQYCSQNSNNSNGCSWKDLMINNNGVSNGLDVAFYHAYYPDLTNAFGGNVTSLVNHYNDHGKNENRKKTDSNWLRTAQSFSDTGTKYIFFRAVSKTGIAGNPSSSQMLKIDKKAPVCKTTGDNTTGQTIKHPITVVDTCTDDLSGCTKSSQSEYYGPDSDVAYVYRGSWFADPAFYDHAGNGAWCKSYTVDIDMLSPVTPYIESVTGGLSFTCDTYDTNIRYDRHCTISCAGGGGYYTIETRDNRRTSSFRLREYDSYYDAIDSANNVSGRLYLSYYRCGR